MTNATANAQFAIATSGQPLSYGSAMNALSATIRTNALFAAERYVRNNLYLI